MPPEAELLNMLGPGAPRATIDEQLDDVLATISLVAEEPALHPRLFGELVDVLVRAAFADLRERYAHGALTRSAYVVEVAELARQCRRADLLRLPLRKS